MDKEEQHDAKQREASLGGLLAGIFILLPVAILVMAVLMLARHSTVLASSSTYVAT